MRTFRVDLEALGFPQRC